MLRRNINKLIKKKDCFLWGMYKNNRRTLEGLKVKICK
jgi:hypothetical protein